MTCRGSEAAIDGLIAELRKEREVADLTDLLVYQYNARFAGKVK